MKQPLTGRTERRGEPFVPFRLSLIYTTIQKSSTNQRLQETIGLPCLRVSMIIFMIMTFSCSQLNCAVHVSAWRLPRPGCAGLSAKRGRGRESERACVCDSLCVTRVRGVGLGGCDAGRLLRVVATHGIVCKLADWVSSVAGEEGVCAVVAKRWSPPHFSPLTAYSFLTVPGCLAWYREGGLPVSGEDTGGEHLTGRLASCRSICQGRRTVRLAHHILLESPRSQVAPFSVRAGAPRSWCYSAAARPS